MVPTTRLLLLRISVITTLLATEGPAFVTVSVYENGAPIATGSWESVFVTTRSTSVVKNSPT
jgi:hypothetical protein